MAKQGGIPLVCLRKLVVFDRLLARMLFVAPESWILKGALALDYRFGEKSRTTKDLDFVRQGSTEAATPDLVAAQATDLGDYFTFTIQKSDRSDATPEDAVVRYHVAADPAGRPFEGVIIDVGFGSPPIAPPEMLKAPDLLGFAEIMPVEVPALPLPQHVAEKFHAYTRSYSGERQSS